MTAVLDPRWEWFETTPLGSVAPTFVRGACNHLEVVPVESADELADEAVAHLCTTCDAQLPAEWKP